MFCTNSITTILKTSKISKMGLSKKFDNLSYKPQKQ